MNANPSFNLKLGLIFLRTFSSSHFLPNSCDVHVFHTCIHSCIRHLCMYDVCMYVCMYVSLAPFWVVKSMKAESFLYIFCLHLLALYLCIKHSSFSCKYKKEYTDTYMKGPEIISQLMFPRAGFINRQTPLSGGKIAVFPSYASFLSH